MDSHYNDLLLSLLVFLALVCLGLSEELVPPTPSSASASAIAPRRRTSTTCADVWDTPATDSHGTWTCGDRIEYNEDQGRSEQDAKCRVASEVPSVCGVCCASSPSPAPPAPAPSPSGGGSTGAGFTIVTQNLYWWNLFGQRHGGNFFQVFGGYGPFDIMFFQECDHVNQITSGLGLSSTFTTYGPAKAVALAWRHERFHVLEKGWRNVGEDSRSQYYGKRAVVWARLQDKRPESHGRTLWIGSHHGPLPVNTGGQDGGQTVADNIMKLISDTRRDGEAVILAGDFNADSNSSTIKALRAAGLNDRADDWVDHVFTLELGDATTTIVRDTGSDHRGIKMSFHDA